MPATNSRTTPPPATPRLRSVRWRVALFFLGWTVLAAVSVGWLISNAANSGNTVIRVGPEEAKAWGVRLRETVALARLNFPWAIAWFFLAPYVLWVGVRYSFEAARWRSRLPVLLVAGAGFIWASQWLSERLVAGQAMIVMSSTPPIRPSRSSTPPATRPVIPGLAIWSPIASPPTE